MAAPPVSRETYLAEMTTLREHILGIKAAGSVEQAIQSGALVQETAYKLTERLIMSMASGEDKLATLERTAAQATPVERRCKSLAESKCIGNMKALCSDKSEFKMWNEKFINAVAQVLGTPWRKYMRNLNRQLDQDRRVLTQEELNKIEGIGELANHCDEASEGLYYVLVEKTEGDAALRVNSGEPGQGIQAYMRVYLWFAGTTGMALSEKTRMLMHPKEAKHEWEIADALEK